MDHAQAAVLIVSGEYLDAMRDLREAMPTVKTLVGLDGGGDVAYADLVAGADASEPPRADEDSLAWLVYTSGTTGRPKGAMLSHRALTSAVTERSEGAKRHSILVLRPTKEGS